ncbi:MULTISPECIES: hypothetical protein [unclassified Mesorhizobium]|uniref:hypothetical protein n=1 Tax=unclassified Mesorhizobium TaxID=325217 RepID=UPI000FD6E4A5|nr:MULTISPECIES: hypothetical protein [unclassified Mesorhizobium]TGQ34696.1 hypothetical protein EN859_024985 [Mesorhizobium sp. M00.F.Ca.ET.216.01.1.1]TIS57573.1 MAG: hypothetical protein E5W91_13510 [Mesorhizobium sp.]TIS88650.1 MAG: hypothetical protein E5W89_20025 [Mesorhizobium sp.]
MNIKMICLSTMVLSMLSGTALAGALDSPYKTAFFTDTSMTTTKSEAGMAMSHVDWARTWKECSDQTIDKQHNDFCKTTKQLGGAN